MYSSRSYVSTRPANQTKAAPGSGSPSPATSPAPTAAISRLVTHHLADCAQRCACRSEAPPLLPLQIRCGPRKDFHEMRFGLRVALEPFADGFAQVVEGGVREGRQGAPMF